MITFGRKLKHLRQKNHLTQKELGMAVGFPKSCADVRISQYESDVRTPKEDLMKLFASKLGVPVELFTVPVLSEPREYEAAENPLPHFSIMTINLVLPLTHTSNTPLPHTPWVLRVPVR